LSKEATAQAPAKLEAVPPATELLGRALSKFDLPLTAKTPSGPFITTAKVEKLRLSEFTISSHPNMKLGFGSLSGAFAAEFEARFVNSGKGLVPTAITLQLNPKMLQQEAVDPHCHPWIDMSVTFRKRDGAWNEVDFTGSHSADAWRILVSHCKDKLKFVGEKEIFDALATPFADIEADGNQISKALDGRIDEMTKMLPPQLMLYGARKTD